jgi:hypothetical protein
MEDEDAQRRRGRSRLFGDDADEDEDDDDDVGVVDGQECNADDDVDASDVVDDARAREITDASRGDACSMSSTTSASDAFVRHASTDSLSSAPTSERVRFSASLRQLYRLQRSGEYVAVGAAGLAILDAAGATSRDVLVYDPEKRPLVRRSIDSRLSLESQKDNYVTLRHGETILWSALMQDEGDWTALAAQMAIAQYISRCKCEGFRDDIMIIDLAKSSSTAPTLSFGDSAQVSYEAVRGGMLGGVAVDEACIDYLDLQLFDGAIERVNGRKVKISTDANSSADSVPSAVLRGILGAGKDSRRLILAPSAPSSFVLYDVTVARTKKGAKDGGAQSILTPLPLAPDAREEDDLRDRMARLDALDGRSPAAHAIGHSNPLSALPETPPAPWWPPTSMPYVDQVFLSDLRRAVSSLSEDVASITQRARTGGVWVPPTLEGELKHAVLELNKVRLSAMLPKIEAETLSMGDVKQLTAEAARIEQFQEEIRELREGMKRMRTELHDALECTSRAEEERDALESQVSLLRRQSERDRERIEIQKRRAEMSGAASAAAAVEAVLVAEDKSFDTDVAEVTAMMRAENEKLMNRLENPGWIEEQDALLAERDALARRVAELEKGSGAS